MDTDPGLENWGSLVQFPSRPSSFPGLMIFIADHCFRRWLQKYYAENWCTGPRDVTEIAFKTALHSIQSIKHLKFLYILIICLERIKKKTRHTRSQSDVHFASFILKI